MHQKPVFGKMHSSAHLLLAALAASLASGCGRFSKQGDASMIPGVSGYQTTGPAPSLAYSAPPYPYGAALLDSGFSATDGGPLDPTHLVTYPITRFAFFQGVAVSVTPSNVGAEITDCTISPSLPAGLSLSTTDCSITGTPTGTSPLAFYTVTAKGASGSSNTTLSLSVSTATRKVVNIPQALYVFRKNSPITTITPQLIGGAQATDCTGANNIPTGLARSGCQLSGTPTQSTINTAYNPVASLSTLVMTNFVVPPAGAHGYQLTDSTQYVPITVLDPTTQPWVSYGGQYFGRVQLKVGEPMLAITPVNTGAAITSCVIAPALPAGLSLSQSDCTVAGTPTVASVPQTYVILPKHGGTTGNSLTLDLGVSPAQANALSCQSGTLCAHPLMPLWSQGDDGLLSYVNAQTGYNLTGDPGWCGPVSLAMLLKTYFQELATYSNHQTFTYFGPFSANDSEYSFIYKTMLALGPDTHIQWGGTAVPSNWVTFRHCGAAIDLMHPITEALTLSEFLKPAQYSHGMPLGWVSINRPGVGIGHAIALNGVEGDYVKFYDPWGSIFNGTISYGGSGSHGTISWVSGTGASIVKSTQIAGSTTYIFSLQWLSRYIAVEGGPEPAQSCEPCYSGTISNGGACQ